MVEGCVECAEHSAGICFKHKLDYWRQPGNHGLIVGKGRPSVREIAEEEHMLAAAEGRKLRPAEWVK